MAMQVDNNKISEAVELIATKGFAGMTEAVQILFNEVMLIERSRYLGLEPYERNEARQDYVNGFKQNGFLTIKNGSLHQRTRCDIAEISIDFLLSIDCEITIKFKYSLKQCDGMPNGTTTPHYRHKTLISALDKFV